MPNPASSLGSNHVDLNPSQLQLLPAVGFENKLLSLYVPHKMWIIIVPPRVV